MRRMEARELEGGGGEGTSRARGAPPQAFVDEKPLGQSSAGDSNGSQPLFVCCLWVAPELSSAVLQLFCWATDTVTF